MQRGKNLIRYSYSKKHDQMVEPPSVYFKGLQDRPPSRIVTDFTYHGNHLDVRSNPGNRHRFHISAREVTAPKGRTCRRCPSRPNLGTTPARHRSIRPWTGVIKRMAPPRTPNHPEIVVSWQFSKSSHGCCSSPQIKWSQLSSHPWGSNPEINWKGVASILRE